MAIEMVSGAVECSVRQVIASSAFMFYLEVKFYNSYNESFFLLHLRFMSSPTDIDTKL